LIRSSFLALALTLNNQQTISGPPPKDHESEFVRLPFLQAHRETDPIFRWLVSAMRIHCVDWLPRDAGGPMSLVLDLHIVHERFGSSTDPSIHGHLNYPNDLDMPLNEVVTDKIPCRL
jgi:hypothetical protein